MIWFDIRFNLLDFFSSSHFSLFITLQNSSSAEFALVGMKPLKLSVLATCLWITHPVFVSPSTHSYISVNLAVQPISQLDFQHITLIEEGERTWHPLHENLQNLRSDKTIYTLASPFIYLEASLSPRDESLCLFGLVLLTR